MWQYSPDDLKAIETNSCKIRQFCGSKQSFKTTCMDFTLVFFFAVRFLRATSSLYSIYHDDT